LKGHIHNPAFYFERDNKKAALAADLLMMTQGWKRYDIQKAIQGDFMIPEIAVEVGYELSGTVIGGFLTDNLEKGAAISLLNKDSDQPIITTTDEQGRFTFDKIEPVEGETYSVLAFSGKGKGNLTLKMEEDTLPTIGKIPYYRQMYETPSALLNYVEDVNKEYVWENGERMINLQEVVVTAPYVYNTSYTVVPSPYFYDAKQIEEYNVPDVRKLLFLIPEVAIRGNNVYMWEQGGDCKGIFPLLIVDGEEIPTGANPWIEPPKRGDTHLFFDIINDIDIDDIERIDLGRIQLKACNPLAIISIQRKKNRGEVKRKRDNIKTITPLGYQKPVEFYSPKYDTPEAIKNSTPDLRNTIYWQPDAVTNSEGKTAISYYTADNPTTYTIVIEGVSDEGKLIYFKKKAAVTVK
jgi:hypothetical protein